MPDIGNTIDFSESVSRFVGRAAPPEPHPCVAGSSSHAGLFDNPVVEIKKSHTGIAFLIQRQGRQRTPAVRAPPWLTLFSLFEASGLYS